MMKKYLLLVFISGLFFITGCGTRPADNTELITRQHFDLPEPDFIPVSVWYSGGKARAPMLSTITENSEAEWRKDIQQIKSLGFNTVRTWVEWAHCEPKEGEYNFENLKLLAKLAKENGLRFIIQLYVDSAPDWVGVKFKEAEYEAQDGSKVASQAAPGYCSDHEGVRKAVSNFITETAKVANQYDNLHGWDLWSEPHIVNWAYINYVPNAQFCFCPSTRSVFREWLKEKYGTLEKLNIAWYRNFDSWENVDPPRFGTILSYTDFIDWKNFIYQKLSNDLGMRYAAVRRADKTHVITSHAAVPSIFYTPYNGYGATDDFLMADQVDYYGTSLYPKHNHPSKHWEYWRFMVGVDFSRSANKNNGGFYVGELQAGKGTIGLQVGNPITPQDHRRWMWSVIAKGARAINIYAYYPMSSGYESDGYGLINLDGTVTERAVEAGKTAKIITENRDLLLSSKPDQAQIAIVYNPLAQMVGGEQSHVSGDMHQLSLFGYYRAFAENNIPVDFIHRRDLEKGAASKYKLVILPYPLMFTSKAAEQLQKYVNEGGVLVSEARPGWNDEKGYAANIIPGMGLAEVFGARESKVKMTENAVLSISKMDHPLTAGLSKELKGDYFAESLELLSDNAEVLATLDDKTAGIVANTYGKGKALLIGSFLGMYNHKTPLKVNTDFILNMVKWAEIKLPFTITTDKNATALEVKRHSNKNGFILYLINHNEEPVKSTITIPIASGNYNVKDLLANTTESQTLDNTLKINAEVPAGDVKVFLVSK